MKTEAAIAAPIDALKALAHPIRNLILRSLSGQEKNVGEIEAVSGVGQPTLSQQLAVLRQNGLVSTRRHGKMVFYAVNDDTLAELADHIAAMIADRPAPSPKKKPHIVSVAQFAQVG